MNKIQTAIEFFYEMNPDYSNIPAGFEIVMIEFAKLHVKAALEEANNNMEIVIDGGWESSLNPIINAYPEELIK